MGKNTLLVASNLSVEQYDSFVSYVTVDEMLKGKVKDLQDAKQIWDDFQWWTDTDDVHQACIRFQKTIDSCLWALKTIENPDEYYYGLFKRAAYYAIRNEPAVFYRWMHTAIQFIRQYYNDPTFMSEHYNLN
ncbi:hypothetical protein [Xanthocytophaga agilis]|nr:hypothetical protein [Xanthocytophaga agilis]